MCGRFVQFTLFPVIKREFNLLSAEIELPPRYNVAPTQDVAAVVNEDGNRLVLCRWGLIPPWSKDPAIGSRMINARAETVADKPSFRKPFRDHRCLVIADGFFEWKRERSRKIPVFVRMKDRSPFGLAGLYSDWRSPEGETLRTCTIITTAPNALLEPIHNRMPVIVARQDRDLWLDPRVRDPDTLTGLLRPYDAGEMEAYLSDGAEGVPYWARRLHEGRRQEPVIVGDPERVVRGAVQ